MSRILNYIGRVLCLCLPLALPAQNLFVKVGQTYGVSAADDSKRVSDKYAAGADTLPSGLYWAWQRWKAEGMPYATFRSRYLGCAIAKDIAWRYEAASNIKSGYQNTYAFADWTDASGHWYANATMQIPRGGMLGAGSFGFYDDTTVPDIFATCEFEMTEDWWPANQTERRLFETPNSSLGTPDAGSYNESFFIKGFRLTGPAIFGDGVNRIGMFIRRAGECSYMTQVFAYQFQTGIMVVGGVPFTFGTLSAFFNERHGFAFMGTWGATITGQTLSGDDNGELLGIHPGYGDEAGGIIKVSLLKNEAGIHGEGPGNPYRKHTVIYAEGQYSITIGEVAISRNWIVTDAAFIVNPKLTNGTPQISKLRVLGMKGYHYRTLLQNLATGLRWAAPENGPNLIPATSFVHTAVGDRMCIDDQHFDTPGTPCNCPPLGFLRGGSGAFDYLNCTPSNGGGTTPPPGTWTCTQWSACNNGTHTRTCTCSGTCTTAKPAESQSCTVTPPPPTMTATASVNNVPAELAKITDGNAGTAWLGKVAMKPGDWILIDYGTVATRSSIAFDIATGYFNGFPGTFEVYVSTNGTSFGNPVKTATGKYPTCEATFTPVSCRYVKMVVKTVNPAGSNWLAISAWR